MDNFSLTRLDQLHPSIREDAIKAYLEAIAATPEGVHPLITQTMRTFPEQAELYAQGRTQPGDIVTNSKEGQSYHNYGLAIDFVLQIEGKPIWKVDNNWMAVVNCFKAHGFDWGGEWAKFKDYPHFEKRLGHHWKDLLIKHQNKDFLEGTGFVILVS